MPADSIFDHKWERAAATGESRCAAGGVVRVVLDTIHFGTNKKPRTRDGVSAFFMPSGLLAIRAPAKATLEEVLFGGMNYLVAPLDVRTLLCARMHWPEKRPGANIVLLIACHKRAGVVSAIMTGSLAVGPAQGPKGPAFFIPSEYQPRLRPRRLRIVK
jgi:hypothetical protein